MKKKYIIPLGDNCEIGGHLIRNEYFFSSLFRYARSELGQIVRLIENDFSEFFTYENIVPITKNMVRCKKYEIAWHTKFSISQDDNGKWIFNKNLQHLEYEFEIQKLTHLKNNLITALESTVSRVIFIYKSNVSRFSEIENFINLIEDKYHQLDFRLLIIKTVDQNIDFSHDKIDVESVRFHAPYTNAMNGGDNETWDQIISKYMKKRK